MSAKFGPKSHMQGEFDRCRAGFDRMRESLAERWRSLPQLGQRWSNTRQIWKMLADTALAGGGQTINGRPGGLGSLLQARPPRRWARGCGPRPARPGPRDDGPSPRAAMLAAPARAPAAAPKAQPPTAAGSAFAESASTTGAGRAAPKEGGHDRRRGHRATRNAGCGVGGDRFARSRWASLRGKVGVALNGASKPAAGAIPPAAHASTTLRKETATIACAGPPPMAATRARDPSKLPRDASGLSVE